MSIHFRVLPLIVLVPAFVHLETSACATPAGGSDDCANAEPIVGTGTFTYDNTSATTGSQGQTTSNCLLFGVNAVATDVWFSWVAPSSGSVTLSNCHQTTSDTKIAVYAGTGCPGASAVAVACNDDVSDFITQPMLFFQVSAGQTYLIQVGDYPGNGSFPAGVPAPGTFTIEYDGPTGCSWDDGSSENEIALGPGGNLCWMARYGFPAQVTTITGISVAYGSPVFPSGVANGTPATVALWKDPNDDGNPIDAVLLAQAATSVQNVDTDIFNFVSLPNPVSVTGVYFVGASTFQGANQYPTSLDARGCTYAPGRAWISLNSGGPYDFANLSANSIPPVSMHTLGGSFRGVWLLRAECTDPSPGVPFCAGDGSAATCPCGNASPANSHAGCLNSLGSGAVLTASGNPQISADSLLLSCNGMPNGPALYYQGTQAIDAGVAFGDGLRCVGGAVVRIHVSTNVAGASQYPTGFQASLSLQGQIAASGSRSYQVWYRNAASFCTAGTFNLSNGWRVLWMP